MRSRKSKSRSLFGGKSSGASTSTIIYRVILCVLLLCILVACSVLGGIWLAGARNLTELPAEEIDISSEESVGENAGAALEVGEEEDKEEPEEEEEDNYEKGASASSTLPAEGGVSYAPENIYDGSTVTAWTEGVSGSGIGEWISVSFDKQILGALRIYNGYQKSRDLYYWNSRVQDAQIEFSSGQIYQFTLRDENNSGQIVVFPDLKKTNSFTLTILSVYEGSRWDDTTITEIVPADSATVSTLSGSIIYATIISD